MLSELTPIWIYIVLPITATVLGAIVAGIRVPPPLVRSGLQHFSAGVVFAALGGEMLPDVLHRRQPMAVIIGFTFGVAVMFGMKRWSEQLEARAAASSLPMGIIVAVGVDALLDGLVIGIAFTGGAKIGALVSVALSMEMLFLGLTTALALRRKGLAVPRVIAMVATLASLIGVGALLGFTVLRNLSPAALAGLLAFGAATLLYLVTEELLVDAHEVEETPLVTSVFFLGFLVLFIVEMAMG